MESAAALAPDRRKVAILGDMLELGEPEVEMHRDLGPRAAELGFSPIVGVGPLSRALVEAARASGAEAIALPDAASAEGWARENVRPDDVVLVKGSRGIGLEVVVDALLDDEIARASERSGGAG